MKRLIVAAISCLLIGNAAAFDKKTCDRRADMINSIYNDKDNGFSAEDAIRQVFNANALKELKIQYLVQIGFIFNSGVERVDYLVYERAHCKDMYVDEMNVIRDGAFSND